MANEPQHSTRRRRSESEASKPQAGEQFLLKLVDAALGGVIFVAPWFMGGRHPLGELVLVALAVVAALAWTARQSLLSGGAVWRRSPLDCILLATVAFVLWQLAPLPHAALHAISPRIDSLLPMWNAGSGMAPQLGVWDQISLTPESTRGSLAVLLAYGLLALVTVQRIEKVEDVEWLLRWLAVSVSLLAVVGLLQYLAGNGKFLWIYEHPFRDTNDAVKGPFINRNHFAHLMALGVGPLTWWILRSSQTQRGAGGFGEVAAVNRQANQIVLFLALGIVLFAGLMTLSRGGAAAIGVSLVVCGVALLRRSLISPKLALSLLGLVVLTGAALSIHGYQKVTDRLEDYAAGSIHALDQAGIRRSLWKADAAAVADFLFAGAGVASHREVYPVYFDKFVDEEMTHAENGYLQIALEAGLPGVLLLLTALFYCARWSWVALRSESRKIYVSSAAIVAGLAASAAHSVGDFVWYIPSLLAITLLLVACLFRLSQLASLEKATSEKTAEKVQTPAIAMPRWAAGVACLGVALMGAWMIEGPFRAAEASPHWDSFIRYKLDKNNWLREDVPDELLREVEAILAWTPNDARAHVRYSDLCLQRFNHQQLQSENQLGVHDFCDAAMASKFPTRAALDQWLSRAAGESRRYLEEAWRHSRLGLSLSPLQGVAYTHLAELCFLEGGDLQTKSAYLAQALRVRPNDGKVLLVAGGEAFVQQRFEESLALWKHAFESGPENQRLLIDYLSSKRVNVGLLLDFNPDLEAVRAINLKYAALRDAQQDQALLSYYIKVAGERLQTLAGVDAARLCLELREIYVRLNLPAGALECLRRADQYVPNDFQTRSLLGQQLVECGEFADAEGHLQWCLQRQPENQELQSALATAVKGRLSHSARASREQPVRY